MEAWECAICRELVYKPVANSQCGHLYCFWDFHRAMNPFSPSSCPLCRTEYAHFPAVAWKLHAFLQASFPNEYAARAEETLAEEEETGVASPTPPSNLSPAESTPGKPSERDLACDACARLLHNPVILNCGHIVCAYPCLERGRPHAGPGCPRPCPFSAGSPPGSKHHAVCKQLDDLLRSTFPEEQARRDAEVAAARQSRSEEDSNGAVQRAQHDTSLSQANDAAKKEEEASDISLARSAATRSGQGGVSSLVDGNEHGLPRNDVPVTPHNALLMEWVSGNDENYPHFGVGCDACGVYPIVGRRYRCLDCPEAIGYDLCGTCHNTSPDIGSVSGRFNQQHRPEHRLETVRPRVTTLHLLKAANPELTVEALMRLLQLQLAPSEQEAQEGGEEAQQGSREVDGAHESDGSDAENGRGDDENRGGGGIAAETADGRDGRDGDDRVEQQQARDAIQDGEGGGEFEVIRMRRGPRPVQDPAAEWPSPSSPGFFPEGGE